MSARPANSAVARGLSYWRRHLGSVVWPVTSSPEVLRELVEADQIGPRLLDAIRDDLPLGLAILMEGQRLMHKGDGVASISHAVGVLGQNRIQSLARTLGAHRLDASKPGHCRYAQAIMTSRLAGHLLLELAAPEQREETQARVWSIQAQTVGAWKLPLAAPEVADELARRLASGERAAHAEQVVLGCRLHELNTAVAQDMGLQNKETPVWVQALPARMLGRAQRLAWLGVRPPEIPTEIGRWLFQPSTLPSLLHMLAHEAMQDWYSARVSLLLKVLSAHRNQRLDDILRVTRRAALAASHEPNLSRVVATPAERLLWPPVPRPVRGRQMSAAPVHTQVPTRVVAAPTQTAQGLAQALVERFVADCEQGRHPNLGTFFKAFGRALGEGLGLKRYALFLKTSQADQLVCFMAQGFAASIVPRKYSVSLTDNNLLARLYAQPRGFLMAQPARLSQVRPMLPLALRDDLRACGAMWATVQVKERSVGVLWADSGDPAVPVQDSQYAGFKQLSRHYGPALTRLMQQQKQAAARS